MSDDQIFQEWPDVDKEDTATLGGGQNRAWFTGAVQPEHAKFRRSKCPSLESQAGWTWEAARRFYFLRDHARAVGVGLLPVPSFRA